MTSDIPGGLTIEAAAVADGAAVRSLLIDLGLEDQEGYAHPPQSRAQMERTTVDPAPTFLGENHILLARHEGGSAPVGMCWVVLFDPGTGLEAEVAEVFVQPAARGQGIATALLRAAMAIVRAREVTFACVWTRDDNPAAMAAYRSAGFLPTEQTVLTWLPLPGR